MTLVSVRLIHERKATRMTYLRDELLWAIDNMVWFRKSYHKCKLHFKHANIEAVIRPLSLWKTKMRRVFQITLSISKKIRDTAGKIKEVFHHFTIELPIELGKITLGQS